jgi:hypothetical protein
LGAIRITIAVIVCRWNGRILNEASRSLFDVRHFDPEPWPRAVRIFARDEPRADEKCAAYSAAEKGTRSGTRQAVTPDSDLGLGEVCSHRRQEKKGRIREARGNVLRAKKGCPMQEHPRSPSAEREGH